MTRSEAEAEQCRLIAAYLATVPRQPASRTKPAVRRQRFDQRSLSADPAGLKGAVASLERQLILEALNQSQSIRSAAQRLGMGRTTVYDAMHRLGIQRVNRGYICGLGSVTPSCRAGKNGSSALAQAAERFS